MSESKTRLDKALVGKGLVATRSQAENYIKLGYVMVNNQVATKPGHQVNEADGIKLTLKEQYVSRAALKLDSVAKSLKIYFKDMVVLDVGSSTGGFTEYALKQGASKVIAVDVGTNQLHPNLRGHKNIELHEQTDIRNLKKVSTLPNVVLIDVSFVSLRDILPSIIRLSGADTKIVAMLKPQFEATNNRVKHKGVIKNNRMRRDLIKEFELWVQKLFVIVDKADSKVTGAKGNRERFYILKAK